MANHITVKKVQQIHKCACGSVTVDHAEYKVRYKELPKAGIRRRVDQKTGNSLFVRTLEYQECDSCNPY